MNAIQWPIKSPGDSGVGILDKSPDAAALRMAEDDDVLHLERLHGKFQRGRNSALRAVRSIGGHQIADIADNEKFARPRIENDLRRDA